MEAPERPDPGQPISYREVVLLTTFASEILFILNIKMIIPRVPLFLLTLDNTHNTWPQNDFLLELH